MASQYLRGAGEKTEPVLCSSAWWDNEGRSPKIKQERFQINVRYVFLTVKVVNHRKSCLGSL